MLVTASPLHVIGGRAGPGRARLSDAFERMLFADCVGYPSCIVARRAAIDAAGGFDPRMLAGEDGDLFLRMSLDCRSCSSQRRTMVKGYTAGLKDWARRTGRMAATMERRVEKARDLVERRGDEGRVAAANGALAWAAALRAIGEGDEHRAADALAQACRLLPALSRAGELVEERVAMLLGSDDRATHVRHLTTAAQAWPEPAADTALFLRLSALLLAVRGADGRQARSCWRAGRRGRRRAPCGAPLRAWPGGRSAPGTRGATSSTTASTSTSGSPPFSLTGPGVTDTPAVSVVMPTYQRREPVRRAVASVLAQTFGDLELIVVDDGSTDGTGEVLRDVDARLRYVWQENAGVASARNRALSLGGRVVGPRRRNRWLPDHLEVIGELLERHPAAVVASTCPGFRIQGEERPADATVFDAHESILAAGRRAGYMSCLAIRAAALDAVGGFDDRIPAGEDTDLLLRVATQGPFVTIRRRTVVRHVGPGTLTDTARRSGGYLVGSQLAALNLVALAERTPGRERLASDARGMVHLTRFTQALAREDAPLARDELAEAVHRLPALSDEFRPLLDRVRAHLPAAHDRRALARALTIVAEQWPDPRAPPRAWRAPPRWQPP